MTSNEIRSCFLSFFESKGHHVVPSAPMVVKNDPTLMFTNAGMNQFKDIFLGNAAAPCSRACDAQKCLRVSGKHNDLEEVGRDTYHHTMFEMLGNWSFGDYFKKEAIAYAWEFLTDVLKIDAGNLYVTVFGGDEAEGLARDAEAYEFWRAHVDESRILLGSKKDNFWEMGDQGPCGPCSEIHVDLRDAGEKARVPGRELVNKDNPLVIEIWNLVFMQYNRLANGTLEPLKEKHIDTGMGFERLCMVMQGKKSNYDTDVFQPLIRQLASRAGCTYGGDTQVDVALRVCADHLRAVAFSIADGQLPSNAKAGYVIRRILRRAVRYGYTFLGFKEPFLHTLLPTLVEQMGGQYPELARQQELIGRIMLEEEQSFLKTLANGIGRFDEYLAGHAGSSSKCIDGDFAFELFDTYGFPVDLTCLMASERGWQVDMEGFRRGLDTQKQRSRAAAQTENGDWVELQPGVEQRFVGYDTLQAEVNIVRYRRVKTKDKEFYQLVLDSTPFYGESGGQVGDRGTLTSADEVVTIVDTKKENNLIVHIAAKLPEHPEVSFKAEVDRCRRFAIECNHTSTHLLHKALRSVLGDHVEQRGSSVDDQRLRFDFSHFAKLSREEIREVEKQVNIAIRHAMPREEHRDMPVDEARKLGAMALFGEKYGERVRVVKFGDSVEFCGGTHIANTGHIGSFRIVSEGAVAAGMRRIEAVTGAAAEMYCNDMQDQLDAVRELLKNPKELTSAVQKLSDEVAALRGQLADFRQQQAVAVCRQWKERLQQSPVLVEQTDMDLSQMRDAVMQLRVEMPGMALVLASRSGDKPMLMVALGQRRVEGGLDAGAIVRAAAKEIQGGGGGQPGYATAGGKDASGLDRALQVARELIG
ncbi:MAG: alanyl-tRNA synthetase [bacterium P3]|nr:MAG: alanyl-tRNA synthetase [bacterium P3]KWW38707.1 MAG: alanyl-tRNA synthetase [bacterium F083]